MFWNKKENKSSLPDLPSLDPKLFEAHREKEMDEDDFEEPNTENHPLPSFPDSPTSKGFSQIAIKEAIESPEPRKEQFVKEIETEPSISSPKTTPTEQYSFGQTNSSGSNVFVKIDKFNSARKAIASAQEKMSDIDKMLKKIRETRMREEQELTAWEKEVENAKTRIEEASKNLFDKLS